MTVASLTTLLTATIRGLVIMALTFRYPTLPTIKLAGIPKDNKNPGNEG